MVLPHIPICMTTVKLYGMFVESTTIAGWLKISLPPSGQYYEPADGWGGGTKRRRDGCILLRQTTLAEDALERFSFSLS
jgi:hypothetical protein